MILPRFCPDVLKICLVFGVFLYFFGVFFVIDKKIESPLFRKAFLWWMWQDSNLRPLRCQRTTPTILTY